MRKLWITSFLAIAVLTAVMITLVATVELYYKVSPTLLFASCAVLLAFIALQFVLGPYLIRAILRIEWVEPESVSPEFGARYRQLAQQLGIGCPTFGIVKSGMPNAFTFGRFVKDARVVATQGLLDALDQDELEAVIAHEFGHIRNRDFVAMSVVQAVVVMIYYAARTLLNQSNMKIRLIGLVAYGVYWLSELGALAFSRIREYMADTVSAESVQNPDALASALIKIGYGLARIKTEEDAAIKAAKSDKKAPKQRHTGFATQGMAVCGIAAAMSFDAVAGWTGEDGRPSAESFARASAWELTNAWARYAEMWSTHPLISRRVSRLMSLPGSRHTFSVGVTQQPDWRRFRKEWLIYSMPFLTPCFLWIWLLVGMHLPHPAALFGGSVSVAAAAGLVRMFLVYPGKQFKEANIADLLADTTCSHVSPIPCTLKGRIATRAEGGVCWSGNLVLEDETGLLVAQRKMFLPSIATFWGWVEAKEYVGHEVVVTGWFRRLSHPCIEVNTLKIESAGKSMESNYWSNSMTALSIVLVFAVLITIAGLSV